MQYNYGKLLQRIKDVYETQKNFAKKMGLSEHSISRKLNNEMPWSQKDMLKASEVLEFENGTASIPEYFFTLKVQS